MRFAIHIADRNIGIECHQNRVYDICKEYLQNVSFEETDFNVKIQIQDIVDELNISKKTNAEGHFYMDELEVAAVYRKIANKMLDYDTFLMHGSVFADENNGYMITARSGVGKTTLMNMILSTKKNYYVVNGDKPLIHVDYANRKVFAYGTPWCGKEHLQTNSSVNLQAICLLERGDRNCIKKISFTDAYSKLVNQTYMPKENVLVFNTLKMINELKYSVDFYQIQMKYYDDVCKLDNSIAIELIQMIEYKS